VIAAGSLLETALNRRIAFPVGRVEFMAMHPCSFREYLIALNENEVLKNLEKDDVPEYAHDLLLASFRRYATIGGMPQVLSLFILSDFDEVMKHPPNHRTRNALKEQL